MGIFGWFGDWLSGIADDELSSVSATDSIMAINAQPLEKVKLAESDRNRPSNSI
jgi:hypothetical protein